MHTGAAFVRQRVRLGEASPSLAEFLTSTNLVPLPKMEGGVHPIACGENLCRLVELAVLQKELPVVAEHSLQNYFY